uniref:Uncharacterized protein n=1 Tax=Hemiselmis andersenii TaxID=464988 RepID=A0A6U4Y0U3_HEMAN|mmetsp:Transcript_9154/g.21360  ORF Transcript_9154/g.21360 Transcript_9154/m.21360 type:complete len:191 (-) Transcript_9154:99-671(-)
MLIPAHPCAQFPFAMMSRTSHSEAQFDKAYFRSPQLPEDPKPKIIGRDIKASAGMRVKLSNAGKQYIKIYDAKHGLHYYDEGEGTIVANGRGSYLGLCDVEWDSGNKPEIDNTYFVYNTGNDGLYHLALVEDPAWGVEQEDVLGMREEDLKRLQARQAAKAKESMKMGTASVASGAASGKPGTGTASVRH